MHSLDRNSSTASAPMNFCHVWPVRSFLRYDWIGAAPWTWGLVCAMLLGCNVIYFGLYFSGVMGRKPGDWGAGAVGEEESGEEGYD